MRKRQKKVLDIIEKILFVLIFISISAMDSPDATIPSVILITSFIGIYICYQIEVRCGYAR